MTSVPAISADNTEYETIEVYQYNYDTRIQVRDVTAEPYKKSVFLELHIDTTGDGIADVTTGMGTGAMVANDVMLTAAHCMSYNGRNTIEMRVHWEQSGSEPNNNWCYPAVWWYSSQYDVNYYNMNYDWLVVKLQKPAGDTEYIGDKVGYFNYSSVIVGNNVTVSGYPKEYAYYMLTDNGNISTYITDYIFRHNVYTTEGQSGSPVYGTSNHTR